MFTKHFSQLGKMDASIAGGKGASLGEMTRAGIPVPPGCVVLSSAFEQFLRETDLTVEIDNLLHEVDPQAVHTVERASEQIQTLILNATMPEDIANEIKTEFATLGAEFVAVRSSATAEDSASAAWAGQLDSFLNTTQETLLHNVQKCWASLFTPRAIFYRFEKNLHTQQISVAVVIQKMIQSAVSGIAFSVHPVTEDRNQLIIEAGYGLGEAIVSGQITPDSYVVEKEPRRILDTNIATQERGIFRISPSSQLPLTPTSTSGSSPRRGEQEMQTNEWRSIEKQSQDRQKLTDDQILELSELIIKIENHYGFPCDIEWALESDKFYIVQSRPITTLQLQSESSVESSLIKIEKTISRDLPFINISAWHKGYTAGMKEWLGWSYSDSLFYIHDGFTDIMRPPEEHLKMFKEVIVERLSENRGWFLYEYKKFLKLIRRIYSFYDEYETCLEACSEKELAHFYREYVQRVTEIIGPFITMIWFPVWCENDPSLAEKYPDEAAQGVQARKKSEQIFPRGDALIGRLLKRVNEKFLFEEPLLKALSSEELLEYLEDGKLPDRDTLKKRTESFIYSKQGITFVEPSREGIMATFAKLGYDYNIPDYSALEEIKGNVAYGGKVRGIVTVVMQKSLIKDFPEGGILVASMTTPEYVPAMKKAVAFITDEGGVTCHAAIVAREMKKPCIIGTKIATQVLHDGDLVEVDADNGVVRIIERAEENAPRYPLLVHDYDVPLNPWSSLNDVFQKYLPELSDRQVSNLDNIFFFRKEEVFRGPNAEHFEHAAKFFSEKLHKESGFIETISKTLRGVFQKVEAYSRKMLKTDFGAAESEVLYSLFDEGWTLYSKIWTWGMIGQFLEMGEDKLSDGFKRRIYPVLEKHGDPEAVFSKLVTPLESSLIAEEMVAVLNLAQEIQKSAKTQRAFDEATDPSGLPEEIRKQLEALADEYGWLQYYYAGPAADFRYYFSLIKKKLSADVQSEIRARIMETQELKAFQDSIERELSKEEKQTVIALREFSFLKEARKESQYLINYSLDGWYEEVATRLSSEPLYCRYILLSEFKRILVDHDLVLTHDDLMNRYSACAYVSFDGKNELKVGEEAEKYGKLLEEKAPTSDEQGLLKGSVAYPGVVTGRVKIVNAMRDMGKFEDGDVLVSVATTPAIVPAMNKAAAIVTDTGGVTCHAAIVAREMKKPCVIGTKVATRALHDGDLVEVDADNGVVRITERSKF